MTTAPDLFAPASAVSTAARAPAAAPAARQYGADLDHPRVLTDRQVTIALRYMEATTRRLGYTVGDQVAATRRAEEQAREAVTEARGLKGLASRVWDAVHFSTVMTRAQLRRELQREQHLNETLAAVAIDCVNVLFDNLADTRRRLCALEAAAGLPVGAAPVAKPPTPPKGATS